MHSNPNAATFSDNVEYFSNSTADGIVYFWNCLSGQLKNEYKPSSHLSATCTCISWGPSKRKTISTPKKKKRKSTLNDEGSDLELVAIGTENGHILLYSLLKEDLYSKLELHSGSVNDISWSADGGLLYSCSSDKHIVEWNLSSSKKSKWKADDNEIHSICYVNEGKLLSASSVIKLWSLSDKSVLQEYVGHATEVWKLLPIISSDVDLQNSGYFISAALGDRVINAWQMNPKDVRKSLASYTLTDEPIFVDVSKQSPKEPILLSVVTKSGDLLIFEHLLNGRRNTPLRPKITVKIATSSTNNHYLPIIGVKMCNDVDRNCLIVYGSLVRPHFEKLSVNSLQRKTILLREDHLVEAKTMIKVEQKSLKVTEPKKSNDVKVLGPAQMHPIKPILESSSETPLKVSEDTKEELNASFEERLKVIETSAALNGDKSELPRADNFVHLLVQGLQSKDRRMLDTVLQRNDIDLIQNTVKKLPLEHLSSLLNEIQHHLYYKGEANLLYLTWLEAIVQAKLSLILTLPTMSSHLESLRELLNIRCDIFDSVYKLKGRLNLMLSQITTKTQEDLLTKQPLMKYQDSSTDDESNKDDEEDDNDMDIEGLIGPKDEESIGSEKEHGDEGIDEEMEGSESNNEDSEYDDTL